MSLLGTVHAMWRYPIKSLAAEPLHEAQIDPEGIPGDRSQALIVRGGHARVGKTYRGKEHNLLHTTGTTDVAKSFAATRGATVELEAQQNHYFDCAPVSVIFDRWLNEASDLVGYELEPLRYRPNIFARAANGFRADEPALLGARLLIGTAVLRVREPIERCVTTTYDLRTGESDANVLRAVAQHRSACLGIYCDVETPGRVRVGDSIRR